MAGNWRVRDVVAHLLDGTLRRLSYHRDGATPPSPRHPIDSERQFVRFINDLNAEWVAVSHRFSPRVLVDTFERASTDLADWVEALPVDAPARFGVSWAGEELSPGWFDIGREFSEVWHHQQQIRIAVGAPSLPDARYLRAVLEIAIRALPHALRGSAASLGDTLAVDVSGPSGGKWTLTRGPAHWTIAEGVSETHTTRVHLSDEAAWRLLFNALSDEEAAAALHIDGYRELAGPLLRARSVVV
jgi:uncharacterized protein (TIGR03083 family)